MSSIPEENVQGRIGGYAAYVLKPFQLAFMSTWSQLFSQVPGRSPEPGSQGNAVTNIAERLATGLACRQWCWRGFLRG